MPRRRSKGFEENPPKQKRNLYPKENVALALKELSEGKKVCQLVRKYGIPASTIRAKSSGAHASCRPGPAAVFTPEEERGMSEWMFEWSERGFCLTKTHLLECVRMLCIKSQRKNPFPNNVPGRSWYENYLKRFPELGRKIADNFAASRLTLARERLVRWFEFAPGYLAEHGVAGLGREPGRIFNCADIELPLCPHPSGRGSAGDDEKKEHVSVLVTSDARGELAPTLIVFAGKEVPSDAIAPKDCALSFSESGSVLAPNFYEYVTKVFDPWLTRNKVERPVCLYIDAHSPFLNMYLTRFCSASGIVLVPLYTNALHLIQPLDATLFVPFKSKWTEACREICEAESGFGQVTMPKPRVVPLVNEILGTMRLGEIVREGFRKCGLHPFDPDAVEFLKQAKRKKRRQNTAPERLTYDLHVASDRDDLEGNSSLADFEKFLTRDQVLSFRANGGPTWRGETREEGLYDIWYRLSQATGDISLASQSDADADVASPAFRSENEASNGGTPQDDDASNACQLLDDISNIYQSTDEMSSIFQSANEFSRICESIMNSPCHEEVVTSTSDKQIDQVQNAIELCIDDIVGYDFQDSNTILLVQGS